MVPCRWKLNDVGAGVAYGEANRGRPIFPRQERWAENEKGLKKGHLHQNVWSEGSQKSPWNWISQNTFSSWVSLRQEPFLKEGGCPYLNTGRDLGNQRQQCMKHKRTFWPGCSDGTSPSLFAVSTQTAEAGTASLDSPIIVSGWCFYSWLWAFEDPTCPLSSLPSRPPPRQDFEIETCL